MSTLALILHQQGEIFVPIVPFSTLDQLLALDFTSNNTDLTTEIINNTDRFSKYIHHKLEGYTYGIGGYNELRTVYARSQVFDDAGEPRRLHLGVDIWGPAGTPVFAPLEGTVHSFAFNDHYGDYGATLILQHTLEGVVFHTLYGHISLSDIEGLYEGEAVSKGAEIAHFGPPAENGHWPPHLHFQIIEDMQGKMGDYPGVCKVSERDMYLANVPDGDLILRMVKKA